MFIVGCPDATPQNAPQYPATFAEGRKIINHRNRAFLAAFAAAVITVACAPNEAEISTKVRKNLTSDEAVKAAQIEIGVNKKIVTLSGLVDTPAVKNRAVELARKTEGVAEVVDQLKVKELGFGP